MSIFEKKFSIKTRKYGVMRLTAREIYNSITTENDEYWMLKSITDVAKACKDKDFPKDYAEKIKIAYIEYFSNLEAAAEDKYLSNDVKAAINYFYNSLNSGSEESVKAKVGFMKSLATGITIRYFGADDPSYNGQGKNYIKMRDAWINEWVELYTDCGLGETVRIDEIRRGLEEDFDTLVKQARKNGIFKRDEELYKEYINKLTKGKKGND